MQGVDAGSWAEGAGVLTGQVLLSLNDTPVEELQKERFVEMLKSVRPLTLKFAPAETLPSASQADEGSAVLTAVAEPGVARLGFQPDRMPPASPVIVKGVDSGSWAEGAGVLTGQVLLSLNDTPVEELQKERFVEMLKSVRPLTLKFAPAETLPSASQADEGSAVLTAVAEPGVARLGFQPDRMPPASPVIVKGVDSGSWAEGAGVLTGQVLLSLNDTPVEELQKERFVEMLKSVRPLTLKFAPAETLPTASQADEGSAVLTAVAEPGVACLGFQPDRMPPASPVIVKGVDSGSWAEGAGVLTGQVLLSLNDTPVEELQKERFVEMLKSVRPLTLKFAAAETLPTVCQTDEGSAVLTAVAEPGVARLGFQPDRMPPASPVIVKGVDSGSWAEGAGVLTGQVLLSLNDTPVEELQKERFVEMLKSVRPLTLKFAPAETLPSASQADEGSAVLTAVAEPGVARLGFQPDRMPPASPVIVKGVDSGSWAEGAGVLTGQVLLSLNDTPVEELQKERFVEMLKSVRPLTLKFAPAETLPTVCQTDEGSAVLTAVAEPGVARLGFQPDRMPPASPVIVKGVDSGSWAEGAGVLTGQVLLSLNDTPVEELQKERFVEMLKSVRPLTLKFAPAETLPTASQADEGSAVLTAVSPGPEILHESEEQLGPCCSCKEERPGIEMTRNHAAAPQHSDALLSRRGLSWSAWPVRDNLRSIKQSLQEDPTSLAKGCIRIMQG